MSVVSWAATIATAATALPVAVLAGECAVALWPRRRQAAADPNFAGRVDVLVPAHNEEAGLPDTLLALRSQLHAQDQIWVIADNCTDATAQVARRCGANVLERRDAERRGKGYALHFALEHLGREKDAGNPNSSAAADVVVILDADCQLSTGALHRIAALAQATGRPVQAGYKMAAVDVNRPGDVVSQLAVLVKNVIRPAGLARLSVPCLLTGSGMAFPWEVLRSANLATGNIVEDMKLSIDLLLSGSGPLFCPEAEVSAVLPAERRAMISQRTRWEHGHLQTILSEVPRLLWGFVRQRRVSLLASALDLAVPPLALLCLAWCATAGAAVACGLALGEWLPGSIAAASGALLAGTVLSVNFACNRGRAWRTLLAVPAYVAVKVPVYARFLGRRQTAWVRTARATSPENLSVVPAPHSLAAERDAVVGQQLVGHTGRDTFAGS